MSVRVYAMTCGWVTMPMNSLLSGEEGTLLVPVPCYLIDHPKGPILFDTGLHRDIFTDKAGYLGKMAKWLDVTFHSGEDITARLGTMDYDASKIEARDRVLGLRQPESQQSDQVRASGHEMPHTSVDPGGMNLHQNLIRVDCRTIDCLDR